MKGGKTTRRSAGVLAALAAIAGFGTAAAAPAPAAAASRAAPEQVMTIAGYRAPGTPARYDRVFVRRFGKLSARKVLVLVPGTFGGAGDFTLVARYLVAHVPDLQVWAEGRREQALTDGSVIADALAGRASVQQVIDYYLGWLADSSIKTHFQPVPDSAVPYAKAWGLTVAMEDLRRVILRARDGGRRTVILGGHSLGASEAAIYPTWDFAGHPGYREIAGVVAIDGGALRPVTAAATIGTVKLQLSALNVNGPWLKLLGLPSWTTGAFAEVGALSALLDPHGTSVAQQLPLLPSELKPGLAVTNQAELGFAFDQATSPPGLRLIQIHSGHLAATGDPRDWVDAGLTPVQNLARDFAQEPLGPVDWYYPTRLTIDVGAANPLSRNPVENYLGLRTWHLRQVNVPYYAFQTALGGTNDGVALGARAYQRGSRVPSLEIVDRRTSTSHLDPLLAAPAGNDFLKTVVPWLRRIRAR